MSVLGETGKKLNRLSPGYAPTSKCQATLPSDIRASWNQLHEYRIGPDYLGDMLTDFERRVRSGLEDERLLSCADPLVAGWTMLPMTGRYRHG